MDGNRKSLIVRRRKNGNTLLEYEGTRDWVLG